MSIRKAALVENEYYHIYNRGNSKQTIFHDKQDYDRFVKLLFLSNGRKKFKIDYIGNKNIYDFERGDSLVSIGTYCLMPNHIHIVLKKRLQIESSAVDSIARFIHKLATGYTVYFNNKLCFAIIDINFFSGILGLLFDLANDFLIIFNTLGSVASKSLFQVDLPFK